MSHDHTDTLITELLAPTVISTEVPEVVDWIQANFFIPEMEDLKKRPTIELYPYQRAVIREALRKDANGLFIYDLILYSDLKKSAKSTIAAAVILYRAWHTKHGTFKIVGNDLKQADSRVFYYIKKSLTMNKEMYRQCNIKLYHIELPNLAVIEALPVDPAGEAGGGDDEIEFTELHAAKSEKHKQMWSEMALSPLKMGKSQKWIDTYAGHSGESPVLEPLYEQIVKPENRFDIDDADAPPDLETYRLGRAFCLWQTKPRLPWQTKQYYDSEKIAQLDHDYGRMHENRWTSSSSVFVPPQWWAECKQPLPAFDKYLEVLIALDAAVSGDCFGLIVISRHGNKFALRYAQKWEPPKGGKIDFAPAEKVVRDMVSRYNVLEVAYDPYQLHDFCTRLANEDIAEFYSFTQGAPRLVADKQFRDIIREKRFMYDDTSIGAGDLTEHVTNANAKTDPLDTKSLRIVKRAEHLKIDLCVCGSMACNRALEVLSE